MIAFRRDNVGARDLRLVKVGDGAWRIAALKIRGSGMHVPHVHLGGGALDDLGAGIQVHAQVAGGFIWIGGALHSTERRFHPYIAVLVANPGVAGDTVADERDGGDSQNAKTDDYGNNNQDDLESIIVLRRGRQWNTNRSGRGESRGYVAHRLSSATFNTKFRSAVQGCAARITERHKVRLASIYFRTDGGV